MQGERSDAKSGCRTGKPVGRAGGRGISGAARTLLPRDRTTNTALKPALPVPPCHRRTINFFENPRSHMPTIDVTETTFGETLAANDIVLVDFWADWCGPCKQFAPTYAASSEQHQDVVFAKVDTEAEQQLSAAAGIQSIPTLMAFREGILVFSQPGALPPAALEQVVTAVKGLDMAEVHRQVAAQKAEKQAEQQA
jgi:thioredoxin 1